MKLLKQAQGGEGQNFLDNLMGESAATEGLAAMLAEKAGLDQETVEQLMPSVAAMAQGGLQKQMPDADGNAMNDILGKFMR
jgi:hypothetical protein